MNENITPTGSSTGTGGIGTPGTSGSYTGYTSTQHTDQPGGSTQSAGIKETVREKSTEAMDALKSKAQSAASDAKDYGRTMLQEQKESLAHRVKEYAHAARSASDQLGGESDLLARPAQRAAAQLERVADYLQNKEPADLFDDLEAFARRRPEIVFGGMFVAGLAAARFFKASSRSSRELYRSSYTGSPSSMGAPSGDIMRTPSTAAVSPTVPNVSAGVGTGIGSGAGGGVSSGLSGTATSSIPTSPTTSSTLPTTPSTVPRKITGSDYPQSGTSTGILP